jgi:hypothetical protein
VHTWAECECRRHDLENTDENQRNVLDNLLYLVRFPVMDATYYTNAVSNSNILSLTEKVELFQYHYGNNKSKCTHFITKKRNATCTVMKCVRFPATDLNEGWGYRGQHDAISFTASESVSLRGVLVYGCQRGTGIFVVSLVVIDSMQRQLGAAKRLISTNEDQSMYEVLLPTPVSITAETKYDVVVTMKGHDTFRGVQGEESVPVGAVIIRFSDCVRSTNSTTLAIGQIPGLLFSLC